MCLDLPFSYSCSCHEGFALNEDQHNCIGNNVKCFCNYSEIIILQISTNVPVMDMGVKISVSTLKDHTHVAAERGML